MDHNQIRPQRLSWSQGLRRYIRDPKSRGIIRLLLRHRKFVALFPFVTDLFAPLLGPAFPLAGADNLVFWPLLAAALFKAHRRIEYYRDHPEDQTGNIPDRRP